MTTKGSFLLANCTKLSVEMQKGLYDTGLSLNVYIKDNIKTPVVLMEKAPTQSKTFAAPSDDDPDPCDERCY